MEGWEPGFAVCALLRVPRPPPYPAAPRPVPAPPSTAFRRPGRGVRVSRVLKSWASRSVCVSLWTSAICPWCKVFSFTD